METRSMDDFIRLLDEREAQIAKEVSIIKLPNQEEIVHMPVSVYDEMKAVIDVLHKKFP